MRVLYCIEDQDIIDRILAHLREKVQDIPTLPLLVLFVERAKDHFMRVVIARRLSAQKNM